MAAPVRTITTHGQYKGYSYRIEQDIAQMFNHKGLASETPSYRRLFVEDRSINPNRDIPGKKFTRADQAEEAIKAYIDKAEAEELSQTNASGQRLITIGGTTNPQILR